ncbi:EspF repeat-containing protein, partial [Escherichia coli]|uniref:EspF repeat-containing protein n=1 Tax=Escherichia coli TaxID=562 RepID=UPI0024DFEA60
QHLAEHGIQPARNMAEHIPPAPNWPAPTPPVQNEQSRPLPDVAQRLMQHLAEHGIYRVMVVIMIRMYCSRR